MNNGYIDNKRFAKLLLLYNQTGNRAVYNEIGRVLMLLVQNILKKPRFINYTQDRKNEMISDALYYMTKYIPNYDPSTADKDDPFNYFTTVAHNAFKQRIQEQIRRNTGQVSDFFLDSIVKKMMTKK